MLVKELKDKIKSRKPKSAWGKGVLADALDLLEPLDENSDLNAIMCDKVLLHGASDWKEYSYGGYGYIYDTYIAARYCTASELKRVDGGKKPPNGYENWLDVQTRALHQAADLIREVIG